MAEAMWNPNRGEAKPWGLWDGGGVYGMAVLDILEEAGFEVYLVNARDTQKLPGGKTDVHERPWLMKLHP